MKYRAERRHNLGFLVASFAEAWIEIHSAVKLILGFPVASFAEAWIEIS